MTSQALSYLPAGLVVVQVHESPTGGLAFTPLPHIHEGLGEGHSVRDVITAARPVEPCDHTSETGGGYGVYGPLNFVYRWFVLQYDFDIIKDLYTYIRSTYMEIIHMLPMKVAFST